MHAIVRIFGKVHQLAAHSKSTKIRNKWKPVEIMLLKRFSWRMYKAVQLGISRERL